MYVNNSLWKLYVFSTAWLFCKGQRLKSFWHSGWFSFFSFIRSASVVFLVFLALSCFYHQVPKTSWNIVFLIRGSTKCVLSKFLLLKSYNLCYPTGKLKRFLAVNCFDHQQRKIVAFLCTCKIVCFTKFQSPHLSHV